MSSPARTDNELVSSPARTDARLVEAGVDGQHPGEPSGSTTPSNPSSSSRPAPLIRFARPGSPDVDAIASIGRRVFGATFANITSPQNMIWYLDSTYTPSVILSDIQNPDLVVLVAEVAGEIAGFTYIAKNTWEDCLEGWPKPVEIRRIYVDTTHHGGGVAKAMADRALQWAREEGYESIWLAVLPENERAVGFYKKCGFDKIGSHEFTWGDTLDMDDIMARRL
jgi:ribosomal protein S18 acetylase RimI-like enzyme